MTVRIINADVMEGLAQIEDESVHCVVTSPPYFGLRDYGVPGQIGLEPTVWDHIAKLVAVFREVRRVMRSDATLWLNYGDAYAGSWGAQSRGEAPGEKSTLSGGQIYAAPKGTHLGSVKRTPGMKPKDLMMLPERLALALCDDGWYVRSRIIWAKPNPMPESVTDRPTKSHEHIWLLSKAPRYYYDAEAIRDSAATAGQAVKMADGWDTGPGGHGTIHRDGRQRGAKNGAVQSETRNARDVWTIATAPFSEAHFATFPPALVERCILAGTSEKGCCAECGAPWVRETAVSYDNPGNRTTNGGRSLANREITAGFAQRLEKHTTTTGWRPSCTCNADVVPCTVLDPFGGSGTTGLVADRLQRNAILIELNPQYAEMARNRLSGDAGMFANIQLEAAA